jgi:hypothetical protein
MRLIRRVAIVAAAVVIAAVVAWNIVRIVNASGEQARKDAVLRVLRRGESRDDFYRAMRAIGVTPRNSSFIRRDARGTRIHNRDFPLPSLSDPNPGVHMAFHRLGGLFLWNYDLIEVTFAADDRISGWTVSTYQTGA